MSDEDKRKEAVDAMLELARHMTMEDSAKAMIKMVDELYDTNRTMPIIGTKNGNNDELDPPDNFTSIVPTVDRLKEAERRGFMRAVEILRSMKGCLCSWRAGETCSVCNRHEYISLLEKNSPYPIQEERKP